MKMIYKLFFVSFLVTIVFVVMAHPLYLQHAYWKNWDNKRGEIEFSNQSINDASLVVISTSKSVKVNYLSRQEDKRIDADSKSVMSMSFKVGVGYRKHYIIFKSLNVGKLVVDFYPIKNDDIRTGRLEFKDVLVDHEFVNPQNSFIKQVEAGDEISVSFKVKKYFDFKEMCQHIDWLVFIIILSLVFFVMFVFLRYLFELKMLKKAPRTDIIFLLVFFVLLVLPFSKISNDVVSERESRVFSIKPKFFENNILNFNYGKQFEQWFNDRFFGRELLINLYNDLQKIIGGQSNKKVLIGQQNWLYVADSYVVTMFQNMNLFSENELSVIGDNIQKFVNTAYQKGVKNVYFYLSPDKETVYPEFYPSYIFKQGEQSRLQQLIGYMKVNYPQINVLNFSEDLLKLKNDGEIVFCKTGSHMTGIGSYYEYLFFMRSIIKDFPNMKVVDFSQAEIRDSFDCDMDLYRILNDKSYSEENAYNRKVVLKKPLANKISEEIRFNPSAGSISLFKNKKAGNNLKLLFVSDSFGWRWKHYLAESVASLYSIFNSQGADYVYFDNELAYIKKNVPDIIVIETTERFLQRFKNLRFPNI